MNPLKFADSTPLDFPSGTAIPGVSRQLMCVPEDRQEKSRQGPRFSIPAGTREEANAALAWIAADSAIATFDTLGIAITVSNEFMQTMGKARSDYITGLEGLRRQWEAAGGVRTLEMGGFLFDGREKLRSQVRNATRLESYFYTVIDDIKETSLQRRIAAGTASGTPYSAALSGDKKIFTSAFKHSQTFTNGVKITHRTLTVLEKASAVVTVIAVAKPVVDLYAAETAEQEEKALRAFFDTSLSTAGAAAGSVVGGAICASAVFSTAGLGAVSCGVVTAATISGLSALGEAAAGPAFQIFGPSTLSIIRSMKTGANSPLEQ